MKNMYLIIQKKQTEQETWGLFNGETSVWLWVALVELLIIGILILKLKRKKNLMFGDIPRNKIKSAKSSNIDMNDLMYSINKSKGLYKELSKKCHPDRFINSSHLLKSQEIFQEITKYKRDYKKLEELKEIAIKELNINF